MDLQAQLLLNLSADGPSDVLVEGTKDFLLIVVNGNMAALQVPDVDKHLNRVT
jgi:hypothetical protein